MVTFTRIPEHYTPLGQRAVYAFESDEPLTVDIRFTDSADNSLLGAKRFVSVREAAFDAAPMLLRAVRFTPTTGGTGVIMPGRRQVMASAELFTELSAQIEPASAPNAVQPAEPSTGATEPSDSNATPTAQTAAVSDPVGASGPAAQDLTAAASGQSAELSAQTAAVSDPVATSGPAAQDPTAAPSGQSTELSAQTATSSDLKEYPTDRSAAESSPAPSARSAELSAQTATSSDLKEYPTDRSAAGSSPAASGQSAELSAQTPASSDLKADPTDQSVAASSPAPSARSADAFAPTRIFLPAVSAVAPALLTTLPRHRRLAPGECDELTLLFNQAGTVTVTAAAGDSLTAESYPVPTPGLYLFRLDTRDFPQAETLHVDAGACGAVDYTLLPAPEGAVRLAWRSTAGSIEHYTFPVVRETRIETSRQESCGGEGYASSGAARERRTTLLSAFEVPAVAEALTELQASPCVWVADADRYTPVDILPGTSVVYRHGGLCRLEIELRPRTKPRMPWN